MRSPYRAQSPADEPLDLLAAAARVAAERVWVERGSMAYSAVTQPLPCPTKKGGTLFSTVAVQNDLGFAELDQGRAFGVAVTVRRDANGAQFIGSRPSGRMVAGSIPVRSPPVNRLARVLRGFAGKTLVPSPYHHMLAAIVKVCLSGCTGTQRFPDWP